MIVFRFIWLFFLSIVSQDSQCLSCNDRVWKLSSQHQYRCYVDSSTLSAKVHQGLLLVAPFLVHLHDYVHQQSWVHAMAWRRSRKRRRTGNQGAIQDERYTQKIKINSFLRSRLSEHIERYFYINTQVFNKVTYSHQRRNN